jgi:hypothetical protein
MCPACIGSGFLLLTGAGSAGGLALVAARLRGIGRQKPRPPEPPTVMIARGGICAYLEPDDSIPDRRTPGC